MRCDLSPEPTCERRSCARSSFAFCVFRVEDARAQQRHRLGAVLVLRALRLHRDDDAGRQMGDPDRRFRLVDVLPAGAARAHRIDLEVRLGDFEVDFLRLRHHGDGGGGRVDASLRLGRRNALHAMNAAFIFEPGEGAAPDDLGDDLLVAARRALAHRKHLDLPALAFRIFQVHAEKVAREQRGFVAARSRANFENDIALVGGVLRQQRNADRLRHRLGVGLGLARVRPRAISRISASSAGSASIATRSARSFSLARRSRIARGDRLELRELPGNLSVFRRPRPPG